jgi:hypothetical protein
MTTDAESRCLGQGRAAAHPSCGRDPPIDLAVVRLVVAAGHLARGPAPPPAAGRAARHPGRAGRGPARARPSTGGRCPAGAGYGGASGRARRRPRGCRAARRAQQPPRPAVLRRRGPAGTSDAASQAGDQAARTAALTENSAVESGTGAGSTTRACRAHSRARAPRWRAVPPAGGR